MAPAFIEIKKTQGFENGAYKFPDKKYLRIVIIALESHYEMIMFFRILVRISGLFLPGRNPNEILIKS
jgi:hypothetical protein